MPPKKQRIHINKLWFFLLEIIGLGLSLFLFLVSASIINIPCPRNSIFACTGIVRGDFGHIGPFSVAAMGCLYFIMHLMLTVGLRERTAQVVKGLLVFAGVIFIAWLRGLELIYIREICPWCWGVAFVTLIHAGVTYTIVAPPLPKLKAGGIIGVVLSGFIVMIGLVSVLELSLGLGKKLQHQDTAAAHSEVHKGDDVPIASPDSNKSDSKSPKKDSTPKSKATPKPTPKSTPSIQVTAVAPTPVVAPSPTPAPTPQAEAKPVLKFDPEPKIEPSEEASILRRRGWRHAGSGASVIKAVKVAPPVLMLAYDPHCSDCHRLITQTLDADIMNSLHVTRIAIQESMLSGQVNKMVTALPTLILFGADGSRLYKHVGSRTTSKELVAAINQALGN